MDCEEKSSKIINPTNVKSAKFFMENSKFTGLKPKTIVLIIAIVLMAINILLPESLFTNRGMGQIVNFAFVVAFNLLTVFWCSYDSAERGEKISSGFILATVIFGVFALFYYLFKTRGFKSGLTAIGKLLLIFFGLIIFAVIVQIIAEFM